ncbi:hypothetical protein H4Q26_016075 [Puccinia striiformis f. sp. tritici PST-130]|nr:hypothetical protein H4Q26_016075 [Puccinia striiformis f. sp. tritici PST-130]
MFPKYSPSYILENIQNCAPAEIIAHSIQPSAWSALDFFILTLPFLAVSLGSTIPKRDNSTVTASPATMKVSESPARPAIPAAPSANHTNCNSIPPALSVSPSSTRSPEQQVLPGKPAAPGKQISTAKSESRQERKEWRALSHAEKADYIKSVKCLARLPSKLLGPSYRRWDDFQYVHSESRKRIHILGLVIRLPEYYSITIGHLTRNAGVVTDGAFANPSLYNPTQSSSSDPNNLRIISSQTDYSSFIMKLEGNYKQPDGTTLPGPHTIIHSFIGGDMPDLSYAANDHVWSVWQTEDPANRTYEYLPTGGFPASLNDELNYMGLWPKTKVRDVMDTLKPPFCYRFTRCAYGLNMLLRKFTADLIAICSRDPVQPSACT